VWITKKSTWRSGGLVGPNAHACFHSPLWNSLVYYALSPHSGFWDSARCVFLYVYYSSCTCTCCHAVRNPRRTYTMNFIHHGSERRRHWPVNILGLPLSPTQWVVLCVLDIHSLQNAPRRQNIPLSNAFNIYESSTMKQ
jgi:hypothetical protein